MSAGKGDKQRPCFVKDYDKRWESINWGTKKAKKTKAEKRTVAKTADAIPLEGIGGNSV